MADHNSPIQATVDLILKQVDGSLAPFGATKKGESEPNSPIKKLAYALEHAPEPALNYQVLHVVKTAMLLGEIGPLPAPDLVPETGEGLSLGLRKLANALRLEDHHDHERLLAKGAHALKASRGLMLLRELVRE